MKYTAENHFSQKVQKRNHQDKKETLRHRNFTIYDDSATIPVKIDEDSWLLSKDFLEIKRAGIKLEEIKYLWYVSGSYSPLCVNDNSHTKVDNYEMHILY